MQNEKTTEAGGLKPVIGKSNLPAKNVVVIHMSLFLMSSLMKLDVVAIISTLT